MAAPVRDAEEVHTGEQVMRGKSSNFFATLLCAIELIISQQLAAQQFETNFEAARTISVKDGKPILAIATASDWGDGSKAVADEHLKNRRFTETFGPAFVLMHVDYTVTKTGKSADEARAAVRIGLERLGIRRMEMLPCAVLLDAQGLVRGRAAIVGTKLDSMMDSLSLMVSAYAAVSLPSTDAEKSGGRIPTAQALLEQKKLHEARAEATEAAKENPANGDAWQLLAVTAGSVAKTSEVREWTCAIASSGEPQPTTNNPNPIFAIRWLRLGDAMIASKREEEALFCYRQSMELERSATLPGIKAANLALKRKDKAGALRDVNEVLRRDFANPEALQLRAKILPASMLKSK
jgi:Tfp pilus assembly protein PilF